MGGGFDWPVGIAGWLTDDRALLVYDNYDIWQVDPSGSRPSINITNHYGIRQHIKFRILRGTETSTYLSIQKLLLIAFNTQNKYNGFYQMQSTEKSRS